MINQEDINSIRIYGKDVVQTSLASIEDGTKKNYFSLLPSSEKIKRSIPKSLVINNPMNTVGGDGYWFAENESEISLAVFDCMGHGHIASMMARVYIKLLKKIINENGIFFPNQVLNELHASVKEKFNKNENRHLGTGADFGVIRINKRIGEIEFSGAKMNLYEVENGKMNIIKADRIQVGEFFEHDRVYMTKVINLHKKKNAKFYLFSDGLKDLIGGPENKKFGSARLKELLESIYPYSFDEQKKLITSNLANWQGSNSALDDFLLVGFSYDPQLNHKKLCPDAILPKVI